jgi:hypothetical protein
MSRARHGRGIVVSGALAQRPGQGGHAAFLLQWLLGLRRCGWDVLFVDRLEPDMLADGTPVERSPQWRWFRDVVHGAGLSGRSALLYDRGRRCLGLPREDVMARCQRAAALLDVMGYLDDEAVLAAVPHRAFVDIDPGFPQMWQALGLHNAFLGYDSFVTVGLGVGQPGCSIPTCGRSWVTTLPPVVLDWWPADEIPTRSPARFTSVGAWRGPYGPVTYEGTTYGLRVHEMRALSALPTLVPEALFEIALDLDDGDQADRALLEDAGWRLLDPSAHADTPGRYRAFLRGSTAELQVAKGMYVRSRSGWFSERSAAYLACGRPVVAQDTGWTGWLPSGEGLIGYTTLDGAAAAAIDVAGDPARHAKAARDLAAEHFDAVKVLPTLLDRIGVA